MPDGARSRSAETRSTAARARPSMRSCGRASAGWRSSRRPARTTSISSAPRGVWRPSRPGSSGTRRRSAWPRPTGGRSSQAWSRRASTPAPRSSPDCGRRSRVCRSCRWPACTAPICPAARGFQAVADPYSDANVYVVPALVPDVAIIHVQEADAAGNGRILGTRFEDVLMAQAARRVILTAERIVDGAAFAEAPESCRHSRLSGRCRRRGAGRRLALLLHAALRIRRRVSCGLGRRGARAGRGARLHRRATSSRRHRFRRDRFRDQSSRRGT